mmetsp:Transcript_21734/g.73307  ORF Transcript_21734/g.73307 Transcript_21734/m.73307 type:complete len:259 (-) Transcript_21734:123-899(-)
MVGASVIGDGAMREERQPGCAHGRASRRRTLPMLAAPVREGDRLRGHPVQVYRRGEHRVRPDRQREGVRHVPQRCKLFHQQGDPPDGKGLRARLERLAGVERRLVPAAPQHDAVRLVEPRRGLPVPRMREHVNLLPTSGRVNHVLEVTRRAVAEQHPLPGVASVVPLAVKVGRARADLGSEHAVKQQREPVRRIAAALLRLARASERLGLLVRKRPEWISSSAAAGAVVRGCALWVAAAERGPSAGTTEYASAVLHPD